MALTFLHMISLLLYLSVLATCWSTSITEHCTTRTKGGPGPGTTKTITTTRYVEKINATTTTTPTRLLYPTTTTDTTWDVIFMNYFPGTTTVTYRYTLTYYTYTTVSTSTSTYTTITWSVTTGLTVTTVPTPSGFEPASSISIPAPTANVNAAATNVHVICHKKYIIVEDVTKTVSAPTLISTKTNGVATITVVATTTSYINYYYYNKTDYSEISTTVYYPPVSETIISYVESYTVSTKIVPTQTAFDACATDNVVDSVGPGTKIINVRPHVNDYGYAPFFAGIFQTPSECCNECFRHENCTGSVYYPFFNCLLYVVAPGDVCDASKNAAWSFQYANGTHNNPSLQPVYISNGPCGRGVNLGYGSGLGV